jgi:hypothetical protein
MSLMAFCYLGAVKPYVEIKTNLNECLNEFCILCCIYVVMFSMITLNIETLDDMTIIFIVISVGNVVIFALQSLVGLVLSSFENCKLNKL